ncbi:MAG: hypothetical protein LBG89_03860 [Rickettsiales bacterium]|jgi:hypothetical protein|nr:hypothetical protein [Rickettsiales bacterium]
MNLFNLRLYSLVLCAFFVATGASYAAGDLTASRAFEATAENSVAAKNRAVSDARKYLTMEIIRRSASDSSDKLDNVLEGFSDADAQVLVKSMSIENERRSATTYTANITINLDPAALSGWFSKNNIKGGALNNSESGWTAVAFNLPEGLKQWKWMNTKLREAGVQNRGGVQITSIGGSQIYGKIPDTSSRGFSNGLRAIGANVYNSGDTLRVSLPADSSKPE